MNFPVNERKVTDAVARLIERSGKDVDYLRIVKLIYLADRESILKRGIPIVGGKYFSMPLGPVISEVMDFVQQRNAPRWKEVISPRRGNALNLMSGTRYDSLTSSEIGILDSTVEKFSEMSTEALVEWCHKNCPEYEEVASGGCKPIAIESMLQAERKRPAAIEKLVARARELTELNAILG